MNTEKFGRLRFTEQALVRLVLLENKARETNSLEDLELNLERMNKLFGMSGGHVKVYTDFSLPELALGFTVIDGGGNALLYGGLVFHSSDNSWSLHS